nr:LysR family transcriptional regulator [Streptomyces sp. DSM 44938]
MSYRLPVDLSRHLRHFLAVAEELHFGRAAEVLGMAQPPLSQSIQRLERELAVELFDRSRRSVALTAAGRLLVAEARALLAAEQRMRTVMAQAGEGAIGTLRAGVSPETSATALRGLLRLLAERMPGLEVDLHELTSGEQLRMLTEARLDVGLVLRPGGAAEEPGLRFGPPASEPLGVVLPRDSALARLREPAMGDLAGHDLILFPRATAPEWYDELVEVCRAGGFVPPCVRHARHPDFLLGLVLAGRGVAFLPEETARRQPRVAWRPLAGHPLRATTRAAWPARSPHPAAPRFAEIAAAVLDGAARPAPPLVADAGAAPWSVVFGRER